jgi:hypothetical protein
MLHNIGRGIFFEQPARKYPPPPFAVISAGGALAHSHAHKGALIGIGFPRRCAFTGADKQRHFAEPHRFTGLQFKIAGLPIAFVQQADDGHTLCHRRAQLFANGLRYILCVAGFALGCLWLVCCLPALLIAGGKRQCGACDAD